MSLETSVRGTLPNLPTPLTTLTSGRNQISKATSKVLFGNVLRPPKKNKKTGLAGKGVKDLTDSMKNRRNIPLFVGAHRYLHATKPFYKKPKWHHPNFVLCLPSSAISYLLRIPSMGHQTRFHLKQVI